VEDQPRWRTDAPVPPDYAGVESVGPDGGRRAQVFEKNLCILHGPRPCDGPVVRMNPQKDLAELQVFAMMTSSSGGYPKASAALP